MSFIIGFDASTQSCSATLVDCSSSKVVEELSVNFGTELPEYNAPSGVIITRQEACSNPLMWLDALDLLLSKMVEAGWDLSKVVAISGSGQQHGSVYLGGGFEEALEELSTSKTLSEQLQRVITRKMSPVWMDSSTEEECGEIAELVGGNDVVRKLSGSIMIERFTGAQIRKFAHHFPGQYAETKHIHLVSSFFASIFAGKSAPIDYGDGAGMNLMNLDLLEWDAGLVFATAKNLYERLPALSSVETEIGKISSYFVEKYGFSADCKVFPWSGDNPCSLVGMGATNPGEMVISLGTSYTLFAAMKTPVTDPNGYGHVFGNPLGGYMSLICFKNGSLAREEVRKVEGVDWSEFGNDYLRETPAGNNGKIMLPFYEPEITPQITLKRTVTNGWSLTEKTIATQVRACTESQILNMRLHTDWIDEASEIRVTGGGSKSDEVCQIIADIFNAKVIRFSSSSSASLGAALMIAPANGNLSFAEARSAFCQTESTFEPIAEHQSVYEELMVSYKELLASALTK